VKPHGSHWTDEQWQAIIARGQDILVAAAAGSGKTAVLVERIIKRITEVDDPVDVDRLLIVTFTNAAAAEMKKRIGEALEKELIAQPDSLYLKRQLSLLNRASISTLHSFCLEVLRRYYYLLDLDPKFRIADDTEVELLREEVLEELLEEKYSQADNEAFYTLVECFSSDRSDEALYSLIASLYDFSRSHPFPHQWLDQIQEQYLMSNDATSGFKACTQEILQELAVHLESYQQLLGKALDITKAPAGPAPYADNIEQDQRLIQSIREAIQVGWQEVFTVFQDLSFSKLKACKGDEYDKTLQAKVKDLRELVKKQLGQWKEEYFQRPYHELLEDIKQMAAPIASLIELTKEFDLRFSKMKKEKGLVDYSDLEHHCLAILMEPSSSLTDMQPSAAALDYREKFVEIMVDEYQDTNLVQESIIRLVARTGKTGNLFMVGDVKQSIYRFRLADPSLFLGKYKSFTSFKTNQQGASLKQSTGLRIDLARNFRSRAEVLDGTNYLFKQVMNEEVGEIEYNEDAELKLGADYPDSTEMNIELLLINKATCETNEPAYSEESLVEEDLESEQTEVEDLETVQLEARLIAKQIKALLGHGDEERFQVYDAKRKLCRPIEYRDMVILLRATSSWAPVMLEELKQLGIPAYAELTTGYFQATEVAIMMSLLKVLDNPIQDIALASVLRSPIVGLNEEELAQIRIVQKSGHYYHALQTFLQTASDSCELHGKLTKFYEQLQEWRRKARQGSLSDLIWEIYRETGYYDFVGGLPGGTQRQANLKALYDRARTYESTSFRGLFRFLRFIERMQVKGRDLGTARALGEQEDVVRIMTIHKSKGLEFPVVFVAGLAKQFNMQDLNRKYLMHKDLGFGCKYIDLQNRISYPMLPQLLIRRKMHKELLAEEMRVLYVALTRAKEKLYLIGTLKDKDKVVEQWMDHLQNQEWVLGNFERLKSKCYLDWIGPAVIRHRHAKHIWESLFTDNQAGSEISQHSSKWTIQFINQDQLKLADTTIQQEVDQALEDAIEQGKEAPVITQYTGYIEQILSWQYPYMSATEHLAKQSVSELKRAREYVPLESETRAGLSSELLGTSLPIGGQTALPERPKFLQSASLTAAERGTAMHLVMQHLPFEKALSVEEIQEFIHQLYEQELLTDLELLSIKPDLIATFYQSEIGQLLIQAEHIEREIPFSFGLDTSEVFPHWQGKEERVMIQGVIDCVIRSEEGITLIDYKTDNISHRFHGDFELAKPTLIGRYHEQLRLYAKALEMIWRKPVIKKYLYFFDGGHILALEDTK